MKIAANAKNKINFKINKNAVYKIDYNNNNYNQFALPTTTTTTITKQHQQLQQQQQQTYTNFTRRALM